ncbi:hypothetical protein ACFPU1_03135 [Thalassorhabdus alkalitolerans]|uniref:Uncharacterized protein n=1 Tax=Thalassorhabdus alkalitolerans TaxID=2282697 RepID=A0ABW0YH62_9BACI
MTSDKSNLLSSREIQSIQLWISKLKRYKDLSTEEKVIKCKRRLKFSYNVIGFGKHRIVYDLNNGYVLKVAITRWGIENNKTEYNIYYNCPEHLQINLCPVLEHGDGWIIMKKADTNIPVDSRFKDKIRKLKKEFINHGIDPKDLWSANLALSEKLEIIVIDYGNFQKKDE